MTVEVVVESENGGMSCCASCGVKEEDGGDVKLKNCSACHLVKYCGIKCQKQHRRKHKRACRQRAAELRDEILFRQPESSHHGDCPICFLPLSLDVETSVIMSCCSKLICMGCFYASRIREIEEGLPLKCAFCRQPALMTQEEADERHEERAQINDPVALHELGSKYFNDGDYLTTFEYWSKAVEFGNAAAHYNLAGIYHLGHGVEQDESKAWHHEEQAAIGGHAGARHNLGVMEWRNGRRERAIKHWIIAAKLGHDKSLESLKKRYRNGVVSKDDFAAALSGHQAAVDATKSPQRKEAEAYRKAWLPLGGS